MMDFKGFPSGKVSFSRIPDPFFNDLLPLIDDLGELKLTIYALWRLDHSGSDVPYLRESDFRVDERFMFGLAATPEEAESALRESLERAAKRGTLLVAEIPDQERIYFFNTPKGRAAIEAIQRGEWQPGPGAEAEAAAELQPTPRNIYEIYEQNIGPLTPMLAETLKDAEEDYPAEWIEEAFQIAVEKNVRNWRYVEAILRRWQERGYDVRKDRRDHREDHQKYADWEES